MFAAPVSPSMPRLEAVPAPAPVPAPTSALAAPSTDQPPALELYDLSDADPDDEDEEDDDDDSSDGKSATDASSADGVEPANGAAEEGSGEAGEDDGEGEDDDEEDEVPEPCPRFYLSLKRFGAHVNYNVLLRHHKQLTDTATTPHALPTTAAPIPPTAAATAAPAPTAADSAALTADTAAAQTVADGDGDGDVLIVGEGKRRRKRQSTQDEYDTNDPFIDDTELPQERDEDDMRTEIEGFHVQIGTVQVRERDDVAVKQEQGAGADEGRKKRQRREWTKRQIPMSAAMTAQLDRIVKECQLAGGSETLGGSHRRLPDELVELLVQLNDIYEKDSTAWDGTERKVLRYNMLERLEAAMGQTRQAIKSRMKTAVQRHRREQLDQQIRTLKQSLQRSAAHDYSDFHHRITATPPPAATKGNVVVHKPVDGRSTDRFEYRPRFSLWMDELLALAAAVVDAAGVKQGDDGRAVEAEGWRVEKELWDEVAGWWEPGVMTAKLIGERVKQARKERRKKQAQQKQQAAGTTAKPSTPATGKPTAPSAAAAAAASDKAKAGKDSKVDKAEKHRADTEKRKRDSGAAVEKTKKKAKTDGKETAKDSSKTLDSTAHEHKSASAKQPKDGSKDRDSTHKRSASHSSPATATTPAASSSAASQVSMPVQSNVFYEPPAGAGRWCDIHFPQAQINVVAKQSTSHKSSTSTSSFNSLQLTQTQT